MAWGKGLKCIPDYQICTRFAHIFCICVFASEGCSQHLCSTMQIDCMWLLICLLYLRVCSCWSWMSLFMFVCSSRYPVSHLPLVYPVESLLLLEAKQNFQNRLLISGISCRSKKTIKGGTGTGAGRMPTSFTSQHCSRGRHAGELLLLITASLNNMADGLACSSDESASVVLTTLSLSLSLSLTHILYTHSYMHYFKSIGVGIKKKYIMLS